MKICGDALFGPAAAFLGSPDLSTVGLALIGFLAWLVPCVAVAAVVYAVLSLPLRRMERTQFVLDLLHVSLKRGKRPEDTLADLARSQDPEPGVQVHLLAAYVESGEKLSAAIGRVPGLFPPQLQAALRAGLETGELAPALGACLAMIRDAPAQSRHVVHYLVVLLTASAPTILAVLSVLRIFVLPKFNQISLDLGEGQVPALETRWLDLAGGVAVGLVITGLLIVLGMLIHALGPRIRTWLNPGLPPVGDWIAWSVPWKRKRMLRDFVAALGMLLDAGIPEERAVQLAADCTANVVFRNRGARAIRCLKEGDTLLEALREFDSTGELRWRMANVARSTTRFTTALGGWRETLDAQAFHQEQASAHTFTTLLVLLNGLVVGLVVVTLFQLLVRLVDAATLW